MLLQSMGRRFEIVRGYQSPMPAWRNRHTRSVESAVPQGIPVRPRGRAPIASSRPQISGSDRFPPKEEAGRSNRPGRAIIHNTRRLPWNS